MGGRKSPIFMVKCIDTPDPQKYEYKTKEFTEAESSLRIITPVSTAVAVEMPLKLDAVAWSYGVKINIPQC